jgi:4-diphosphocytidyl-2-C-methyl-D-erythritol kinase
MICFPNAKINIGLNVLEKRGDGYHAIESIFYPVNCCDAIEATETAGTAKINLAIIGNSIPGSLETNLCVKVYNLLNIKYKLPSINLWLLKRIPIGAGLGGGSADAAFFLKLLNELFQLKLSNEELKSYALQIGSDCTFFIDNKPALVSGRGDVINPIELDLNNYYISIVSPQIHVDTKNAYSLIKPHKKPYCLKETVFETPIQLWKEIVVNDFEEPIFKLHPELAEIKNYLYTKGAIYASMTGSGSALYGIFEKKPYLDEMLPSCKIWSNTPKSAI